MMLIFVYYVIWDMNRMNEEQEWDKNEDRLIIRIIFGVLAWLVCILAIGIFVGYIVAKTTG